MSQLNISTSAKGFESAKPPLSNRGVKPDNGLYIHIDWFSYTIKESTPEQEIERMKSSLPHAESMDYAAPSKGYSHAMGLEPGFVVSWHPERPEIHCRLPGEVMRCLPGGCGPAFVAKVVNVGGKCTRLDVAITDFNRTISPEEMFHMAHAGELCLMRKYARLEEHGGVDPDSLTFYAGSRGRHGSGKYFRCYDKELESRGEIDAIRYEVEFSRERANEAACRIRDSVGTSFGEVTRVLHGLLLGAIDFRVGSRNECLDRRERNAKWGRVCQGVESIRLFVQRPASRVARSLASCSRQYGPTLSNLAHESPKAFVDFIRRLFSDAAGKGYRSPADRGKGEWATCFKKDLSSRMWAGSQESDIFSEAFGF